MSIRLNCSSSEKYFLLIKEFSTNTIYNQIIYRYINKCNNNIMNRKNKTLQVTFYSYIFFVKTFSFKSICVFFK